MAATTTTTTTTTGPACRILRVLTFSTALSFPSVRILDHSNTTDLARTFQYSWSPDGVCWCGWTSYDEYRRMGKNLESDFYLRVLIDQIIGDVYINDLVTQCYSISLLPDNQFLSVACDNPNLFNPYANLDCALLLQQQLADSVICLLGIPVYYFRVDPDSSTADWTFKEYMLHNVVDCKQIKLMIPDGQMPSSNPKMTDLDFDWEVDWETELSKTQFARAFGDQVFPKARDFLYIPMMKRMWEVNAAYDEKQDGLMWRSTTWKLSLVKFSQSTSVDSTDFEEIIDQFALKGYPEAFGNREEKEQDRTSGLPQITAPSFTANNLYSIAMEDAIRASYTRADVEVISKMCCHHNQVVTRNMYRFFNDNGCVNYQKGYCGENGAVSFILETQGHMEGLSGKEIGCLGPLVLEAGYVNGSFYMKIGTRMVRLEPFSTYLVTWRSDRSTFTQELHVYQQVHRTDFPIYLLKPEQFWFDLDNPVASEIWEYDNDLIKNALVHNYIHPYPLLMTNIKVFEGRMSQEDLVRESLKYITDCPQCVLNDLARPFSSGRGYEVK